MSNYGVMAWAEVPYSQIGGGTAENLEKPAQYSRFRPSAMQDCYPFNHGVQ